MKVNIAGLIQRRQRATRGFQAYRSQYVQMGRPQACGLGAGASDIGILAQQLRRLQGDPGEFAIADFNGRGLLWADETWCEIDGIVMRAWTKLWPGPCTAWHGSWRGVSTRWNCW
jgi:hypothetical protein